MSKVAPAPPQQQQEEIPMDPELQFKIDQLIVPPPDRPTRPLERLNKDSSAYETVRSGGFESMKPYAKPGYDSMTSNSRPVDTIEITRLLQQNDEKLKKYGDALETYQPAPDRDIDKLDRLLG